MEQISIAICEDCSKDSEILTRYINEYLEQEGLIANIDLFTSGEDFLKSDTEKYSLIFLDIYMDKINGMDTARALVEKNNKAKFIFCSTTKDFAVESYDVSALNYLVKPIDRNKLFRALNKYFSILKQMRILTVKIGRNEESIYYSDIVYIESYNKKSIIHTINGDIEVSMPFSWFCENLKEPEYLRVIRYALVSVNKIISVPSDVVKLSDGVEIKVSRMQRKHVKDVFMQYRWKISFDSIEGEI